MDSLSFPRRKPRWIALSVAYRLTRVAKMLIGHRRLMRLYLNLEWIAWRLAYELSGTWFGAALNNSSYGVSRELLTAHVPAGGTILDIGCGGGRLAALVPAGATYIGLDRSPENIANAQRAYPHATWRIHDFTAPWPDGLTGDVGLVVGLLEHLDDPVTVLQQLRRVVRTLIVEVPDVEADPLNWARRQLGCRWYSDDDHVREYTKELLGSQLTRAGWKPVAWVQRSKMVLAVCHAADDVSP